MVEVRHVRSPRVRPARRIVNVGFEHHTRRDATVSDSRASLRTLNMLSAFLYVYTPAKSRRCFVRAVGYVHDDETSQMTEIRDLPIETKNTTHARRPRQPYSLTRNCFKWILISFNRNNTHRGRGRRACTTLPDRFRRCLHGVRSGVDIDQSTMCSSSVLPKR